MRGEPSIGRRPGPPPRPRERRVNVTIDWERWSQYPPVDLHSVGRRRGPTLLEAMQREADAGRALRYRELRQADLFAARERARERAGERP